MAMVDKDMPRTSYRCNECPREALLFESSGDLIEHMKSEHGCEPEDIELQDVTIRKRSDNLVEKMRELQIRALTMELVNFMKWGYKEGIVGLPMNLSYEEIARRYVELGEK